MSKEPKTKKTKYKVSIGDRIISILTYVIYSIFAFVCVYPFYYIFINTISANDLSERGKIVFWPKGIHFTNYLNVMKIDGLLQATKISLARTGDRNVCNGNCSGFPGIYVYQRNHVAQKVVVQIGSRNHVF